MLKSPCMTYLVRAQGLVHLSQELRGNSRFLGGDVVEVERAERDAAEIG